MNRAKRKQQASLATDPIVSAMKDTFVQRLGLNTGAGLFGFLKDTLTNVVLREAIEWLNAREGRKVVITKCIRCLNIQLFDSDGNDVTNRMFKANEPDSTPQKG